MTSTVRLTHERWTVQHCGNAR